MQCTWAEHCSSLQPLIHLYLHHAFCPRVIFLHCLLRALLVPLRSQALPSCSPPGSSIESFGRPAQRNCQHPCQCAAITSPSEHQLLGFRYHLRSLIFAQRINQSSSAAPEWGRRALRLDPHWSTR